MTLFFQNTKTTTDNEKKTSLATENSLKAYYKEFRKVCTIFYLLASFCFLKCRCRSIVEIHKVFKICEELCLTFNKFSFAIILKRAY